MNHHSSNPYRPPSRMNTFYGQRDTYSNKFTFDFLKNPSQIHVHSPKKNPMPVNPRVSLLRTPTANTDSYVKKGFVAFPTKRSVGTRVPSRMDTGQQEGTSGRLFDCLRYVPKV